MESTFGAHDFYGWIDMCTSIVVNKKKTIIGWNLDILDMTSRVRTASDGVFIEINDPKEGWLPLFGANAGSDFVGMPTCWPFDERSNPTGNGENIILLAIQAGFGEASVDGLGQITRRLRPCCRTHRMISA